MITCSVPVDFYGQDRLPIPAGEEEEEEGRGFGRSQRQSQKLIFDVNHILPVLRK